MPVKYKAIGIGKPGVIGGGEIKYYASIDRDNRVKFPDILEEIAELNVAHHGAIYGVMETFFSRIYYHVSNGRGVEIGSLGSFYPSLSSLPSDSANEVRNDNIKKFKLLFRPSSRLKSKLNNVKFIKISNGTDTNEA